MKIKKESILNVVLVLLLLTYGVTVKPSYFAWQRHLLVMREYKKQNIRDSAVMKAMQEVPREKFVRPDLMRFAYNETPLAIEEHQTISQPYIVAFMAQALELKPNDTVLEIGAGSGYAAAVLSRIVSHVYSIEYFPSLVESAKNRLQALGYTNISVRQGDGFQGWPAHAPYQGISVTAASKKVPEPLLEQLAIGGRLVIPLIQKDGQQKLVLVTKKSPTSFIYKDLIYVRFVPFL